METVSPFQEGMDAIKEAGGEACKMCYQCGLCDTRCPWNRVRTFYPRRIMREALFGLSEVESEDTWLCTSCGNCVQTCPRGVKIIDVGVSVRRIASTWGAVPHSLRSVRGSLSGEGNPWGEERQKRADWAQGLSVKEYTAGTEVLYFPGCVLSYDSRMKHVAVATVKILQKAGVDFGILGTKENCCGESIRKTGDEDLFHILARENIKNFIDNKVKKIVVSSPHCYHTFKNEYSELGINLDVVHISQYLGELIRNGRLKFSGEFKKKVAYHDPCYLGRHNNIYQEPRDILAGIPGLELVEMDDSRENSLCCGGGGGRIWMDTPKEERFANLRVGQALDAGAKVLSTFCPYCMINFEDSRLSLPADQEFSVMDVTEIIQEVL